MWNQLSKYFYELTPEVLDHALERLGLRPIGRVFALNSLENRVYEIEISPSPLIPDSFHQESVVVKFYRPGRWSREAIQEEHNILLELYELEIPVIAPLALGGETLFTCQETGFLFAIFPKIKGQLKDELDDEELKTVGRLIARVHNVGNLSSYQHRPTLNPENYISVHFENLKNADALPSTTVSYYISVAKQIQEFITPYFRQATLQRIHGDIHRGNIIWSKGSPWLLDFDDTCMGPIEQDLWLLVPGRDQYSRDKQEILIEAYNSMSNAIPFLSPFIIEAHRSLRMIHFNGWITKRWDDPIFKRAYENFATDGYWEMELLGLKEQLGLLQDLQS